MRSVKLCLLLMFLPATAWAVNKPVEIFVGGVEYPSMEAYKQSHIEVKSIRGAASVADEDFLRAQAAKLGIDFDPQKVKTVTLAPAISTQTAKALQAISYEHGVGAVQADFQQNWDDPAPKFTVHADELEQRLKAVAGDRKGPILIVSDNDKLRVVGLSKDTIPSK